MGLINKFKQLELSNDISNKLGDVNIEGANLHLAVY